MSYCKCCANSKVATSVAEFVDGGWSQESDGTSACESCGCLLDCTLTDAGAESEKEHFISHGVSKPLTSREAYQLTVLLDALPDDEDVIGIVEREIN